MTNKEWKNLEERSYQFYDTLDFSKYLIKGIDLNFIIDQIEADYNHNNSLPDFLHNEFFNYIDDYSFGYYLAKRYNLKLREEVSVTYFLS